MFKVCFFVLIKQIAYQSAGSCSFLRKRGQDFFLKHNFQMFTIFHNSLYPNVVFAVGVSTARLAAVYRSSESCSPVISQLCREEDIQLDQRQQRGPSRLQPGPVYLEPGPARHPPGPARLHRTLLGTPQPARTADRRLQVGRGNPGKLPTPLVHHKEYTDPGMTLGGRRSYL